MRDALNPAASAWRVAGLQPLLTALLLAVAGPLALRAGDPPSEPGATRPRSGAPATQRPPAGAEPVQMKRMVITGSYIPQRPQPTLRAAALQRQVSIIDQETIRRSGSSSVAAILRRNLSSVR